MEFCTFKSAPAIAAKPLAVMLKKPTNRKIINGNKNKK